jgi:hypothetical protein
VMLRSAKLGEPGRVGVRLRSQEMVCRRISSWPIPPTQHHWSKPPGPACKHLALFHPCDRQTD